MPVGSSLEPTTMCTSSGPPEWLAAMVVAVLLVASVAVPVILLRIARLRAELPEGQQRAVSESLSGCHVGSRGTIAARTTLPR